MSTEKCMAFCPCHNYGRWPADRWVSQNRRVASADLPLLAQCVPNQSRIRFRETTVTKAQEKYRAVFEGLQKIVPDE
jgi:hypothetical protein